MNSKKVLITCPNCNNKFDYNFKDEFTTEDINGIITKEIFKIKCKHCHKEIMFDYPFTFKDEDYVISYNLKNIQNDGKKIMRYCQSYDDFKEKLLIFSASLNDILIEFIKEYIKSNVENKNIELKFDSVDKENIVFYDIINKQYMGLNLSLYNSLFEHSKIKQTKGMIEINDTNYMKYIKVKL